MKYLNREGKWIYTPREIEKLKATMNPDDLYTKLQREEVELSIEQWRELKIAQLDYQTELKISEGFTSELTGWTYSYNQIAQQNFAHAMRVLDKRPDVLELPWKVKEYLEPKMHTREQIIHLDTVDAVNHKMKWQQVFWDKRILIHSCKTFEEVASVALAEVV